MGPAFYSSDDTVDSPALFTAWSLVHTLAGVFIQSLLFWVVPNTKLALFVAFVVHLLYEAFDILGSYTKWFKPIHDGVYEFFGLDESDPALFSNSALNGVGDLISFAFGQTIAWKLFVLDCKKTATIGSLLLLVAWFAAGGLTMTVD